MEKKYCRKCKKETKHIEDVETFISLIKGFKFWICKICWTTIREVDNNT